jgi:hypothetical protein
LRLTRDSAVAVRRIPKTTEKEATAKTKPVGVDLEPPVHNALRRLAADEDMSMAAFARRVISEWLGFKHNGSR